MERGRDWSGAAPVSEYWQPPEAGRGQEGPPQPPTPHPEPLEGVWLRRHLAFGLPASTLADRKCLMSYTPQSVVSHYGSPGRLSGDNRHVRLPTRMALSTSDVLQLQGTRFLGDCGPSFWRDSSLCMNSSWPCPAPPTPRGGGISVTTDTGSVSEPTLLQPLDLVSGVDARTQCFQNRVN